MLPITQYPRRFPTASKRILGLTTAETRSFTTKSIATRLLDVTKQQAPRTGKVETALTQQPTGSSIHHLQLSSSLRARSVHTSTSTAQSMTKQPKSPSAAAKHASLTQSFGTAAALEEVDSDSHLYGERSDDWYTTARHPVHDPNFPGKCSTTGTISSIAMPNLNTCTRQDLLDYLDNTWGITDAIFATLQGDEAFITPPPHQLRHPLIFYYGHATVFYINKLVVAGLLDAPLNPYFEHIFEVGVDEMRWDDMNKNEMEWPDVSEVTEYRRQVYQIVRNIIETHLGLADGHAPIDQSSALWALPMAFEHDRIHIETTSMLMQEHPERFFIKSKLLPDYHASAYRANPAKKPVAGVDYPVNEFLPVSGGPAKIGKPRDFPTFGWDNEYGQRTVDVPECEASKFLISNGEFYEFVTSGGYLEPEFWSQQGWEWRCFRNTKWPSFWVPNGPSGSHQYKLRAIFNTIPMQWDWPAQVNYHEAKAFCKWKNAKDGNADSVAYHLTTEPLHQLLRDDADRSANTTSDAVMEIKNRMADDTGKNLNLSYLSACPVDAMKPTASGFHDVFGNSWEWCEDMFNALPGFHVHHMYEDFSTPCFDGEHQIILGGSFISSGDNGASKYARYHFRPHFFQHAGFRLVAQPIDRETKSIKLATTCVNAPGPYAKPAPFRDSEVVSLDSSSPTTANFGNYQKLFQDFYRQTEHNLELFIQSVSATDGGATMLVRNGVESVRTIEEQLKSGDVVVVVHDAQVNAEDELPGNGLVFKQATALPVFKWEGDNECRVGLRTVSVWRMQ
ncbi:TPA: hypothetical protein N0F65_005106 [Lagenidium giganteum]|uniref:Sulfatase-modifying factor enzyme domain-containing protein n=1 Tax=Lagenidium giganteum TaxID=4803 RepID=A0AAV2Z921_9STRA|nr:TPA: hypothetical protein N0F65_005106 [Lagenidium giganteum]